MNLLLAIVPLIFVLPASGQHHLKDPQCLGAIHGVVIGQNGQPVKNLGIIVYPLGDDLDVVLARVKTDERGEYRFGDLCPGWYSTFVDDPEAGYFSGPHTYQFLYVSGSRKPELHPRG
jgi:hypothetical protein